MPRPKDALPLLFRHIGLHEEEWKDRAECVGVPVEIFFDGYKKPHGMPEAMAYCNECIVKQECYDYAVRNRELFGVWGGVNFTTKQQRKIVKSKRELR